MNDIGEIRHVSRAESSVGEEGTETLHALQIATTSEGHNSGRSYYLQASSQEELGRLKFQLQVNAKAARKRAQARTVFRHWQYRVRKIYESPIFQALVALFITGVNITFVIIGFFIHQAQKFSQLFISGA